MALQPIYLYWHGRRNVFFDPLRGRFHLPRFPQRLRRLDNYVIRLQAVNTFDFTPGADYTAPSTAVYSLANYTDAITGLKSDVDAADYEVAFGGYLDTDTAWHGANTGARSFALAADSDVDLGALYFALQLLPGPTTVGRVLPVTMEQEFVSGSEPSAPVTSSVPTTATGTIPDGSDRVNITVDGMTADGEVAPYWKGAPQSTLGAVCGTNVVTVIAGGPVSGNTAVGIAIHARDN
jgi:hypothetical protein